MKRHLMNRPTNLIQSIALSVLFCAVFMTSQAQTATRYLCVFKKNNLIFEKDSFDLLQNILADAGVLKERVLYEDLVTTEFAQKAAEQK